MTASKYEIARWMVEQVERRGVLYQDDAVEGIVSTFGHEWTYENENGNPAINRGVLTEFRKIKPERVEWDNSDKSWS